MNDRLILEIWKKFQKKKKFLNGSPVAMKCIFLNYEWQYFHNKGVLDRLSLFITEGLMLEK